MTDFDEQSNYSILYYRLAGIAGAALIACGSIIFRMICLGLMLLFVTYLVKATISSNSLAMERPDLEETINELEELFQIIKEKKTEHQL